MFSPVQSTSVWEELVFSREEFVTCTAMLPSSLECLTERAHTSDYPLRMVTWTRIHTMLLLPGTEGLLFSLGILADGLGQIRQIDAAHLLGVDNVLGVADEKVEVVGLLGETGAVRMVRCWAAGDKSRVSRFG